MLMITCVLFSFLLSRVHFSPLFGSVHCPILFLRMSVKFHRLKFSPVPKFKKLLDNFICFACKIKWLVLLSTALFLHLNLPYQEYLMLVNHGQIYPHSPLLQVCVHCYVCTWMDKCRAWIPSRDHHTWLYVTSLSLIVLVVKGNAVYQSTHPNWNHRYFYISHTTLGLYPKSPLIPTQSHFGTLEVDSYELI